MKKKTLWIVVAAVVVLGIGTALFHQRTPNEYAPAEDEIALHIHMDTKEDIGLLVYDYTVEGHEYSGGISNADGSMMKSESDHIVVWKKAELQDPADGFEMTMQFRLITEYVTPNFENLYPDEITERLAPLAWEVHFGGSYAITITGDKNHGYEAKLMEPSA